MLSYFLLNFSSNAFCATLFCCARSWGVRGRENERKIRLLTFPGSSNQYVLMTFCSYSAARSPEGDGKGTANWWRKCKMRNGGPAHLGLLKSWSQTLIYQALFFLNYMHYPILSSHQLWSKTVVPIFQMETFCLIRVGSIGTCPMEMLWFSQDLNIGMSGSRSHAPSATTWNRRQ